MPVYAERERADFWQLYREPDGSYLDPLGPKNCQTHTASRLIMRANEGVRPAGISGVWPPTGYAIRQYTGDTSGGVNHGQVASVASNKYKTVLSTRYNMSFEDFIDMVEETRGAGLSVWYKRIRDSSYKGSTTFYQNHEIFIGGVDRDRGYFTGVIDPLADGRFPGLYKGPGSYPISLLRMAAGDLNVSSRVGDYVRLGTGLCYAIFTKPTGGSPVPAPAPVPVEKIPMMVLDGSTVNALLSNPTQQRVRLAPGVVIYSTLDKTKRLTSVPSSGPIRVPLMGYPGTGWRGVMVTTRAGSPSGQLQTVQAYVDKDDAQIL